MRRHGCPDFNPPSGEHLTMSAGYRLARSAFHRFVAEDEKVSIKMLRELDAADHAHASLVEAFIRLKHDRK
jgi:hypothetical protein